MDLSPEELKAIKAANQSIKAKGGGNVTILWKRDQDGVCRIEKVFANAEFVVQYQGIVGSETKTP